jgi:hypothetical protein
LERNHGDMIDRLEVVAITASAIVLRFKVRNLSDFTSPGESGDSG